MFEELKELGLTDNEVTIYQILLKYGAMKPAEIAKRIGQSRPYVYDSLERLEEKQIVSSLVINNKKVYQATNPERLGEIIRTKLERVEAIIPRLLTLTKLTKED